MNVGTDREQGLKVIDSVFRGIISRDQVGEFDIQPLIQNDETVGMLMIRGPEVHVAILPPWRKRWLSRGLIKAVLGGLEDQYGYCLTSCFSHESGNIDFIQRLGFHRIHDENGITYFERTS